MKMPSFEDLKKAGANLVDSAKSGKLVDNIKMQIESVGERLTKEGAEMPNTTEPVKEQFALLHATLKELQQVQAQQAVLIDKCKNQLMILAKVVEAEKVVTTVKTTVETTAESTPVTKPKKEVK